MILYINNLTEDMAKEITDWKYSGEYSVYNHPSWEIACKNKFGITDKTSRAKEFVALLDENNSFIGYMRLRDTDECVMIGVGLKPTLCGQGLGQKVMSLLISECKKRYGNKTIRLIVRSFNKRAIKCYERAGFKAVNIEKKQTKIGELEFITMELFFSLK